jgi:prepilin-type N-terminal cleavage/methylation domain-containing protein
MKSRNLSLLHSRTQGFTLSEILIALLIFSIAAVVLIGLFPLAHQTQKSAMEQTRAALIASNIMEALTRDQLHETIQIAIGTSNGIPSWESISSAASTNIYVAYDSMCQPCRVIPLSEATNPIMDLSIVALASVTINKKRNPAHLVTVEVVIESPPSVPPSGRASNRFVRLISAP